MGQREKDISRGHATPTLVGMRSDIIVAPPSSSVHPMSEEGSHEIEQLGREEESTHRHRCAAPFSQLSDHAREERDIEREEGAAGPASPPPR